MRRTCYYIETDTVFSEHVPISIPNFLGSALGKFTEVSVSGCKTSNEKCILVRGTNASLSIAFTPSKYECLMLLIYL